MVNIFDDGTAEFSVYLPNARRVEVLGGFTGWHDRAIEMKRDVSGWWTARVELPVGDHEFQYLADGTQWMPDYAAGGIRMSPYGSWVSLLHIPAETRPAESMRRRAA